MLPNEPPTVEGRVPTPEEMQAKAGNGRYYITDVWIIEREFPTADVYETRTDLPNLVNTLYPQIRDIGYEFVDVSHRMDNIVHALQLATAWAAIVREARTTDVMYLVRRTPANSGAMLMMQRQEHIRGQCSEWAPLAYIALVRADQLVVTRDRVSDQATTERVLIQWAKGPVGEFLDQHEQGQAGDAAAQVPNMPAALFKQQMNAMHAAMDAMGIGEEAVVEDITDQVDDLGEKVVKLHVDATGPETVSVSVTPTNGE